MQSSEHLLRCKEQSETPAGKPLEANGRAVCKALKTCYGHRATKYRFRSSTGANEPSEAKGAADPRGHVPGRDRSLKTEERTRERVRATASEALLSTQSHLFNAPSNPTNDALCIVSDKVVPVPSARLGSIPPGREGSSIDHLPPLRVVGVFFDGEFDPGSGRTLAACLTHASRTRPKRWQHCGRPSGERVSNT